MHTLRTSPVPVVDMAGRRGRRRNEAGAAIEIACTGAAHVDDDGGCAPRYDFRQRVVERATTGERREFGDVSMDEIGFRADG
jgi:hypothetical protein